MSTYTHKVQNAVIPQHYSAFPISSNLSLLSCYCTNCIFHAVLITSHNTTNNTTIPHHCSSPVISNALSFLSSCAVEVVIPCFSMMQPALGGSHKQSNALSKLAKKATIYCVPSQHVQLRHLSSTRL